MRLAPITVKQAMEFVRQVHRRLPDIQGGMWAVQVADEPDPVGVATIGVAIVGHAARAYGSRVLSVLRVAVLEGYPNACSMLYGSCSRAAKALGADDLVTYTHLDELGSSLIASGWVYGGLTEGGEYDRPSRRRRQAVDPGPKHRWWAPWGIRAQAIVKDPDPEKKFDRVYWASECMRVAAYAKAGQKAL